jgi:hypothetical protein
MAPMQAQNTTCSLSTDDLNSSRNLLRSGKVQKQNRGSVHFAVESLIEFLKIPEAVAQART